MGSIFLNEPEKIQRKDYLQVATQTSQVDSLIQKPEKQVYININLLNSILSVISYQNA